MNLEEALEASVTEDVVTINDSTIVVNNDLRTMSIPEKVSILGVESDESVNRLKFRLPRYYCDLDLGEFNIYVNYLNGRTEDIYVVTDKKTTSEYVEFSWLVGRNAFKNKGYTKFVLCLKKSGSDGTVIKEFNTTVHKLEVLEGLETEVDSSLITQNKDLNDLIDQIKIMIDLEGKKVISNLPKDYQKLTNEVSQLKEDLGNVVKITETKSTNKLNFTNVEEQEKNGITMSYQDNVLFLNGTASAITEFTIPLSENLQDGTYKFYYELLEGVFSQNILYGYQSNSYAQFTKNTTTVKDTYVNEQNRSKISLTKDQKFENCKFHIWCELSSEATGIFSIPGTTHKDIAFNNDLEIPQVKKNESEINNLQKILATEQNYELITGKMVYKNGEIKSDKNSACVNLRLETGDTIIFKASGSTNHAIISESTSNFEKIINIITVGTSNDEMVFEYTADQDIYLVLSCRANKEYSIKKILYSEKLKSALLNILSSKEDYKYLLKVFENKKGLCIGDSLTYGVVNGSSSGAINTTKNYPYWFGKITGFTIDVDGHPGWTASQMYERVKSNNYAEYGFILLFLGTNGGLTTDEQISAYKQIIEKFISDNNDVKIFLITPFTVNGYSKQDTVDKIYDIGKEKEIAVVNADIAPFKYTVVDGKIHEYDITHLSEMGYFLLANVIANGMGKGIYDYLKQYNEC